MNTEIKSKYILQSADPFETSKAIKREFQHLILSDAVRNEARKLGIDPVELETLEFNIAFDEKPALSPGEIATLAVTIVLLDPTGKLVEMVLTDLWKEVIFPRLLDWINNNDWSLKEQ